MEPWLRAASGADVTIRRGGVPTVLPDPEPGGLAWRHSGRRTLLRLSRGVRFLVEDGRAVRYETERGTEEIDVRAFLLGKVWAVLGWQRGLLPLHASSVARGPDLHAFVGGSGAGKSTLAAALARHGCPLFTDDVLFLDPASFDAGPLGHGHGDLRLCRRSLALTAVADRLGLAHAGVRVPSPAVLRGRGVVPRRRGASRRGSVMTAKLRPAYRRLIGEGTEPGVCAVRRGLLEDWVGRRAEPSGDAWRASAPRSVRGRSVSRRSRRPRRPPPALRG